MRPVISKKSTVELYELSILEEKGKCIVGRHETEIYCLLPKVSIDILNAIRQHKRVGVIEDELRKKHGSVDVLGFIHKLLDHGFVKSIDKKFIHHQPDEKKRLLQIGNPEKVSWLFSSPMYALYFIVFMLGLIVLIVNPSYFPKSHDYFFTDLYILLIPLSFVISWLFVFLHELGHYVAARSLGITAHIGISHRLHYLVATTRVTNLYSLSRHRRFRVILAGIFVDLMVIALGFLALFASDTFWGFSPLIYALIKFVILIQVLGILWQFLFFMKTDIYYAFEHLIGVYNLMQKTKQFLLSRVKKTFTPHYAKRDALIIKLYSGFIVLGVLVVAAIFIFYSLPILYELFATSLTNLFFGIAYMNFSFFYDKLLFLLFFAINQSLFLYTVIKHYALAKKPLFYVGLLFLFIATNYFIVFFAILLFLVLFKEALIVYILSVFLGIGSCIVFIKIIKKFNRLTTFDVIPELFVFSIALVYGFVLYSLSHLMLVHLGIPGKNSLLIGICYAVGISIGYMYVYEKVDNKAYHRHVERIRKS